MEDPEPVENIPGLEGESDIDQEEEEHIRKLQEVSIILKLYHDHA